MQQAGEAEPRVLTLSSVAPPPRLGDTESASVGAEPRLVGVQKNLIYFNILNDIYLVYQPNLLLYHCRGRPFPVFQFDCGAQAMQEWPGLGFIGRSEVDQYSMDTNNQNCLNVHIELLDQRIGF